MTAVPHDDGTTVGHDEGREGTERHEVGPEEPEQAAARVQQIAHEAQEQAHRQRVVRVRVSPPATSKAVCVSAKLGYTHHEAPALLPVIIMAGR